MNTLNHHANVVLLFNKVLECTKQCLMTIKKQLAGLADNSLLNGHCFICCRKMKTGVGIASVLAYEIWFSMQRPWNHMQIAGGWNNFHTTSLAI